MNNHYEKLRLFWHLASKSLGFEVVDDFEVYINDGKVVKSILLVKGFGAINGMLIVKPGTLDSSTRDALSKLGFGYSVMYEPLESEQFEIDDFIEILEDWGEVKNN